MADNVTLNSMSGGDSVAADDIGGVKYQRVKLVLGADGAADLDVDSGQQTMANSLPVAIASNQSAVPVSAASLPLPSGAATEATLSTLNGKVTACNTGAVTVSGALPAGNNNIGDVDIASLPAGSIDGSGHLQADVLTLPNVTVGAALPAGTNVIGVAVSPAQTTSVYDGTTALTPKFAVIHHNTNGNNTIVAAVAGKKIRVLACALVAAGAVTVTFQSGAGGTALTGSMSLAANGGFVLPFNPVGWFETGSNTLLNIALNAAVYVDGCLTYVEV